MFLDVTDNFLRDVNMDPDTWKDTCVTYLIFQPDELLEERVSVKLANFAVNIADHLGEVQQLVTHHSSLFCLRIERFGEGINCHSVAVKLVRNVKIFSHITAETVILFRDVIFDDLINGLFVIVVISEDETVLIEAAFERNSACSKCDCYLLSLIRGQCNIFFIAALIIVTDNNMRKCSEMII